MPVFIRNIISHPSDYIDYLYDRAVWCGALKIHSQFDSQHVLPENTGRTVCNKQFSEQLFLLAVVCALSSLHVWLVDRVGGWLGDKIWKSMCHKALISLAKKWRLRLLSLLLFGEIQSNFAFLSQSYSRHQADIQKKSASGKGKRDMLSKSFLAPWCALHECIYQ